MATFGFILSYPSALTKMWGLEPKLPVTTSSASVYTTPAFWERLWRTAGIQLHHVHPSQLPGSPSPGEA